MRQHYSHDTEAAVLGSVLNRPDALRRLDALEFHDFHHPRHQAIWSAILGVHGRHEPVDATTVAAELERTGKADVVGGIATLGMLMVSNHLTAENVEHYAATLQRHRVNRDLRLRAGEIIAAMDADENAGDDGFEGEAAVQWAVRHLQAIRTTERGAELTIGQIVTERLAQLDGIMAARARGESALTGLPTGVADLDRALGGYQPGIVTVIAGRPAMGKSAVMRSGADACSKVGIGAHVFSLEDTRDAYADRAMSSDSNVPATQIRQCDLKREDMIPLGVTIARLKARPHWLVDDRSGLTASDVVRSWRRAGEANGTKLVVVDYLQRLKKRDSRQSSHEHLGEAMAVLADAAKDDKIAVVVGCQLNRQVEQREDKRPMLSDLRESGSIEELAKCVIACYRGAYYGPNPVEGVDYGPDDPVPSGADFDALLLLLVIKNSNGQTGQARAVWNGPTISAR